MCVCDMRYAVKKERLKIEEGERNNTNITGRIVCAFQENITFIRII